MSELKILLPQEAYELSNGETITVSPVPFGKLRLFSEAIARLFTRLQESGLKLETINDYQVLFDVAFDEVISIMSLVLGKSKEWFDTIDMADGLGLLNLIIEQNFNEKTKKNLKKFIEKMTGLLQIQSKPSSVQGTDGVTS